MTNKTLDEAFDEGVWAIAITPGGKYIGQLVRERSDVLYNETHFAASLGKPMVMRYPLEFASMFLPRQMPGPNGQAQVGFDRIIQAYCLSRCYDVESLEITITPVDLIFLSKMSRGDRDWHKELIRAGIKGAVEARARASGLLIPTGGMQEGHA